MTIHSTSAVFQELQETTTRAHADEASVSRKSGGKRILAAMPHPIRLSFQACAFVILILSGTASAANLKQETLKAWEEYVVASRAQMEERLRPDHPFLLSDEDPGRAAKLRSGEILVSPANPYTPKRVPSGLIHDWNGEAFIANANMQDVLAIVRDYGCYKEVYRPAVVDSRAIAAGGSEDQFSMLLMNKSLIARSALDSDFRSSYFRMNDQRWYSVSESRRLQEVADYGTSSQHMLPENQGSGLIWRIYSITRFEERDGGVYIAIEAIVLSRDIPVSLRWIVSPIVRRISRESLSTSLYQTEDAVSAAKHEPFAVSGRCSIGTIRVATAPGR